MSTNGYGYCPTCGGYHILDTSATCPPPQPTQHPFTCPVCAGRGRVRSQMAEYLHREPDLACRPCDGTGIVWGPPQ